MAVYLDSSAIVKLVIRERESSALRRFLRTHPERVSCGLARTEVLRAVRPHGPAAVNRARRILRRLDLIRLDDSVLDAAGILDARILRSLDAVHLTAAQVIAPELDAFVAYDRRLAQAASLLGFHVETPAQRQAIDVSKVEARSIVDPALKLMIEPLRRYDGQIVQLTGHGIFALCGAPVAHEEHTPRCGCGRN